MEPAGTPTQTGTTGDSDLADKIVDALQSQSSKHALTLLFQLQAKEQTAALSPELQTQKQRLQIVAIPLLSVNELVSIFQKNLGPVLEFNVGDRLKRRFVSLPLTDQDELKQNIQSALELNTQSFVSGVVASPAAWIEQYNLRHGQFSDFLKNNVAYITLTKEEQLKVERLMRLYQQISAPSSSPAGIEDEVLVKDEQGKFQVLREGQFIELNAEPVETPPTPSLATQPVPLKAAVPSAPNTTAPNKPSDTLRPPVPPRTEIQKLTPPTVPPVSRPAIPRPVPAPPSQRPGPDFYFHREDEEEVNRFRTRLADAAMPGVASVQKIADRLVTDFRLTFADESLRSRFVSIVTSRLKDVRDLIETKNMLMRPIEVGGIGLPETLVMQILSQVEEEILTLHTQPAEAPVVKEKLPEPPPVKPNVEPIAPVPETVTPAPPPVAPIAPVRSPVPPKTEVQKPAPPPVQPTTSQPARPIPIPLRQPTAIQANKQGTPIVKRPVETTRPVMSDIRRPAKTVGPVDEILRLTPDDYRRLGKTLAESNDKIAEKLDLLEEDSYLKRAEGVKAWKKNAVHRLYLEIGRESMERNMAISDVIRQRQEASRPALTEEEFHAVADLNKRISF